EKFLNFPYATHYVQKREFDFATGVGSASYLPEEFSGLKDFSKLVWLEEDQGQIGSNIFYELTSAHSAFHQVFWIKSGDETLFFGGDDAPQLQQMKSKFVAKYDFDGKKCMALRQSWWEKGQAENWTFLFYHDINSPAFRPGAGS
ncbi:MAG: MBL fold metallo-hydrolase, partial [Sphingobacteriia bacterium]